MVNEVLSVMTSLARDGMTMLVVTANGLRAQRRQPRGVHVRRRDPRGRRTLGVFTNPRTDRAKDFLGKILHH
jgi:glutamate transport system ATP-binding protein